MPNAGQSSRRLKSDAYDSYSCVRCQFTAPHCEYSFSLFVVRPAYSISDWIASGIYASSARTFAHVQFLVVETPNSAPRKFISILSSVHKFVSEFDPKLHQQPDSRSKLSLSNCSKNSSCG